MAPPWGRPRTAVTRPPHFRRGNRHLGLPLPHKPRCQRRCSSRCRGRGCHTWWPARRPWPSLHRPITVGVPRVTALAPGPAGGGIGVAKGAAVKKQITSAVADGAASRFAPVAAVGGNPGAVIGIAAGPADGFAAFEMAIFTCRTQPGSSRMAPPSAGLPGWPLGEPGCRWRRRHR